MFSLQLNVDPSGPALDLEVPLEVVLGTIPLMQVVQNFPPMAPPGYNTLPSAPNADALYPPQPNAGFNMREYNQNILVMTQEFSFTSISLYHTSYI